MVYGTHNQSTFFLSESECANFTKLTEWHFLTSTEFCKFFHSENSEIEANVFAKNISLDQTIGSESQIFERQTNLKVCSYFLKDYISENRSPNFSLECIDKSWIPTKIFIWQTIAKIVILN
jgi:hypothetical protein